MKARKFVMLIASVGLVFGMMTGCGGGSSDDDYVPGVGLEEEKVNEFVGNIADELGCTYTEATTPLSSQESTTLNSVELIKKVIISGMNVKDLAISPIMAATEAGTCGGSVTMPDDLFSTMTGTITFNNYCLSAEEIGSQTTIDGSITLSVDEDTEASVASTPIPLTIVSSSPETGNTVNVTIDLDRGTLVNEDGSMVITITELTITDNVINKVYTISNFTANYSEEIVTFNGTFNNPEVTGAVAVDGSVNTTTGETVITATDQDGIEVELSSTSTEGVFDVSFDDAPLGTMDCSDVTVPEIPEI